jgi:hypothetical protein
MPLIRFVSMLVNLVKSGYPNEAQQLAELQRRLHGVNLGAALTFMMRNLQDGWVGIDAFDTLQALEGPHRTSFAVRAELINQCFRVRNTDQVYQVRLRFGLVFLTVLSSPDLSDAGPWPLPDFQSPYFLFVFLTEELSNSSLPGAPLVPMLPLDTQTFHNEKRFQGHLHAALLCFNQVFIFLFLSSRNPQHAHFDDSSPICVSGVLFYFSWRVDQMLPLLLFCLPCCGGALI